jgi:hypothetical protein
MDLFAYTLSEELRSVLADIDDLRRDILLTPLSPVHELRAVFSAMVDRIRFGWMLDGQTVTRQDIWAALGTDDGRRHAGSATAIIGYRTAYEQLRRDWLVTQKPMTARHLESFTHTLALSMKLLPPRVTRGWERDTGDLLTYVQAAREHPVAAAGLTYLHILSLPDAVFPVPLRRRVASLTAYAMLFRGGYDVRGLVCPETGLAGSRETYEDTLGISRSRGNATSFMLAYATAVRSQLTDTAATLRTVAFASPGPAAAVDLNDRQKSILSFLTHPDTAVTNRKVQNRYRVSQITASRDLAKLAALGLIVAHGRGRSTSYTRV